MGLKISQMIQALVAQDSDVLAGVQNDSNKKFPLSLLYQYVKGKLTPTLDGKQSTITASGILKGDGAGGVSAAVAGTDYQAPLTAGTDYATPAQLEGKANQTQLADVESGSTASRAYAVGEYFCWGGTLYRAKTAISSGATFTVGTNCVSCHVMDAWGGRHILCCEGTSPANTNAFRVGFAGINTESPILIGISLKHNNNVWYDQSVSSDTFSVFPFVSGGEVRFTFTSSGATNFGGNPFRAYVLTM